MNNDYVWTKPGTDISLRWRTQYGWIPPSETQEFRDKCKYLQELPLRNLDDGAKEMYEIVLKRAKVVRIK